MLQNELLDLLEEKLLALSTVYLPPQFGFEHLCESRIFTPPPCDIRILDLDELNLQLDLSNILQCFVQSFVLV